MKERPILMSGPLVRQVLAGAKTQTRRLVKHPHLVDADTFAFSPKRGEWEMGECHQGPTAHVGWMRCPYGQPGERLWVRETWACLDAKVRPGATLAYRADTADGERVRVDAPWRPSIHMPRWACRLVLEVTEVRVERLQSITEEDARAEGVEEAPSLEEIQAGREASLMHCYGGECGYFPPVSYYDGFRNNWVSLYGADSWDANPWVWALSFRVLPATPT